MGMLEMMKEGRKEEGKQSTCGRFLLFLVFEASTDTFSVKDIALWDLIEALGVAGFNGLLCFLILGMLDQRTLGWLTGINPQAINRRTTTMLESGNARDDSKYRIFQIKFCHRLFFGAIAGLVSFLISFLSLMLGITFYPASIMASSISGLIVIVGVRFSGTSSLLTLNGRISPSLPFNPSPSPLFHPLSPISSFFSYPSHQNLHSNF